MRDKATNTPGVLKEWRKREGLSLSQAAKLVGVKQRRYDRWEYGEAYPPPQAVELLAQRTGLNLESFFPAPQPSVEDRLSILEQQMAALTQAQPARVVAAVEEVLGELVPAFAGARPARGARRRAS